MKTTCVSLLCDSVLPRPFLQGAAPCPFLVTPCLFLNAEMTPCFFTKKIKGRASFHDDDDDDDDDDDEMTPSKSWDKTAAASKLFTH